MPDPQRARPCYAPYSAGRTVNKQLGVDLSEPKHTISFRYPIFPLVEDDEFKEGRLISPQKARERYPLEELVDDDAVIRNASQLNKHESSFFLVNGIDARQVSSTVPDVTLRRPGNHGLKRLLDDLESSSLNMGKSKLEIMTYMPANDSERNDGNKMMVRVVRSSRVRVGVVVPCWSVTTRTYDFSLQLLKTEEFKALPVVSTMRDLLWRRNTRALRHVAYWMEQCGYEDNNNPGWLPSRKVKFVGALDALLVSITRDELMDGVEAAEDDRVQPDECGICHEPFVFNDPTASHRPVRLRPCGHVYGYECMQILCETEIVENGRVKTPSCPYRCLLFPDTTALRRREHPDGTFYDQPNFTPYENFEISCADIDAAVPVQDVNDEYIIVQSEMMKFALKHFETGALLETSESTPFNLMTVRWLETQVAILAMQEFMRLNNGVRLTYECLSDYLHITIADELLTKYRRTMPDRLIWDELRADMNVRHWARHRAAPVRKGFYEFVDRLIHRIVMFYEIRQCRCGQGAHKHGARTFWNPNWFIVGEEDERKTAELHRRMRQTMEGINQVY